MTSSDDLITQLRRAIADAGPRILVAYSGGLDSSVLVDLADRLYRRGGPAPELIHIDHGLRPNSKDDARFCRQQAARRSLPISVTRLDLDPESTGQAAARTARMAAIAEEAAARGITEVLFAHHGDDRIESFLFHLRRGTGLDGLTPMATADDFPIPGTDLRLLRPLLDRTRAELEEYARRRDIDYITDPTNKTDKYTRNRIRHHLVDQIAETDAMRRRLLDAIDNLQSERHAADRWTDHLQRQASMPTVGLRARAFRRSTLADAPEATVARLFHRLAPQLDSDAMHRIYDAICSDDGRARPRYLTLSGCVITVVRDRVVFELSHRRGAKDVLSRRAHPIDLVPFEGGSAPFFGARLRWELMDDGDETDTCDVPDGWSAEFDADDLNTPLHVAGFIPGAKLTRRRPDGTVYHQKLTKLLSAHRVDADCRWRWPCLYDGDDHLIWAAGLPRGATAEPGPETDRRWRLTVVPSDDLAVIIQS